MAVGSGFRPKHTVVALAEGADQAGQPDDEEIEPAEASAVGSMPELVHANLIAKNIPFAFALHPAAGPKVDEGTQRHTHTKFIILPRHEGDATEGFHAVDLTEKRPHHGIGPAHQGLWQFPSEPRKQLEESSHDRAFGVGQKEASGDLGHEAKTV